MPWVPVGVAAGVFFVIFLIAYLIIQAGGSEGLSASDKAEQDASPDLPGTFVPSQGRGHYSFSFSLDRTPTPFCEDVPSGQPGATLSGDATETAGTPASQPTPAATSTPAASPTTEGTPGADTTASANITPVATATPPQNCYASNPPSSGRHLNVARNVDVGDGALVDIPPAPDVYPSDVVIPREAIPHLLEHAGVFVGYNCAEGDDACQAVVDELTDVINDRLDNHNDRVVLARDPDLPVGEIGMSSWTRFDRFPYTEYDEGRVEDFVGTHACRFDPEGFCG